MVIQDFDIVALHDTPLAVASAHAMQKKLHIISITHFADTESLLAGLQKQQISGKNILLTFQIPSQQCDTRVMVNNHLFNLLLLISALRACEVKKVMLFLPYLPYARQEKIVDGQVEPMFTFISNLLRLVSVDVLIASDVHTLQLSALMPFQFVALDFEAFWSSVIQTKIIGQHSLENFCIVSPDHGGKTRVEKVATLLGLPIVTIFKRRTGMNESESYAVEGDVYNKIAIILDDILDTGKTAINAANLLREHGAQRVIGCFTHAVLSRGACERLAASCIEKIYLADTLLLDAATLPSLFCVLSSEQYLIDLLRKIYVSNPNL